jgi:hypothetical protein
VSRWACTNRHVADAAFSVIHDGEQISVFICGARRPIVAMQHISDPYMSTSPSR